MTVLPLQQAVYSNRKLQWPYQKEAS